MGPKKKPVHVGAKRKVVWNTIEVKKEIIAKYENGTTVSELSRMYGKSTSTICTILSKKEAIKKADVAKGVKILTKQRTQTMEEVEKLLLIWLNEKLLAGDRVSAAITCAKAKQLHEDLMKDRATTSAESDSFKASRGWFQNFKMRTGLQGVVKHREATNQEAAEKFVEEFRQFVEAEGFLPQQVFNCDETGLFWKKLPDGMHVGREEELLQGHKPSKDRLTLLLCGNASGDVKLKPLLVYHLENPQVFRKNNVVKSELNVLWRANRKAWVTRQLFMEWLREVFAPSVRTYLVQAGLPVRALLVLDGAPAHPSGLEGELVEELDFITLMFLPPNTTPLIQPMDQLVICHFKKLYTKALFQKCLEVTSNTQISLTDFWRNRFNILISISLVNKAWEGVSPRTMNLAWRKLWQAAVEDTNLGDVEEEAEALTEDIVSLGRFMGLDISDNDVLELVEEHSTELTTEELQELHREQQQTAAQEAPSDEGREEVPSSLIKDMCGKWAELQSFVEKHHPDKAVADRVIDLFNQNAMSHFREMLQRRQNGTTLEFILSSTEESEENSLVLKKLKKEESPEHGWP